MNPKETLLAVKELLNEPHKWAQGNAAYTAGEEGCSFDDPAAVCWCFYGALNRVTKATETEIAEADACFRKANGLIGLSAVIQWNDAKERKYEDIIAALDKGIACAEELQS